MNNATARVIIDYREYAALEAPKTLFGEELLSEKELLIIDVLLLHVANRVRIHANTLEDIVGHKFGMGCIKTIRRTDFENALRFLVNFSSEDASNSYFDEFLPGQGAN